MDDIDKKRNIIRGILYMVLSTLCFTIANASFRSCKGTYPISEVLFFRHFFGGLTIFSVCQFIPSYNFKMNRSNIMLHFTRAVISLLSMGCLFVSLQLLPFAEATVLIFTVPFIVALLSGPYLKEPLTIHGWTSVFIGFVGVAIILRPDGSFIHLGAIAGLLSAFLQGLIVLSNRYLSRSEDAMSIVLTFHLIATLAILPFVLGDWRSVSLQDGILLVIVGIMGGMGQYFMTLSSQHAAANYILPFMYTSVLWATPIGMFFFGEAYDWTFFLGAALIIGGGLSIVAFMPQKTEKKNNYPSSRSEEEEKDREDFMLGS